MKHSPTPWTITGKDREGESLILDANGEPTAVISRGYNVLFLSNETQTAEEVLVDVVHAVNNHDALVKVVEDLMESACYWSEYDVPCGIVDRMRAALAKAKEVPT